MNKMIRKGQRTLNKAIAYYTSKGYRIAKVEKTGMYVIQKDLFGLFDLVGVNRNGHVIFVQVTTNTPHIHSHYHIFVKSYPVDVRQWVWYDRKGFKEYQYTFEGHKIINEG